MVTFNVPSVIFGLERIAPPHQQDRKSTRLNSSHLVISYAVFCLKKKIIYARSSRDVHSAVPRPRLPPALEVERFSDEEALSGHHPRDLSGQSVRPQPDILSPRDT